MRDDEIREWTSIGVSRKASRRYALQCDADELEFLSPTIAEMRMAARALQSISREESNGIFNARVEKQNKKIETKAVCVKCGKWFDRETGQEENGLCYCGYCHAVCFAPRDTRWIPGKKE